MSDLHPMKREMIQDIASRRNVKRIILHILFWVLLLAAQVYYGQVSFKDLRRTSMGFLNPLKTTICLILVYYPLMYYVVPRFFYRKKYWKGIFAVLLLGTFYTALDAAWEIDILYGCKPCLEILQEKQPSYYAYLQRGMLNLFLSRIVSLGSIYQLFVLLALPVGLKMWSAYFKERITSLQLAKENVELEFNFLKAQVNPHFLFNTLNNIYALILNGQKEQSAETVSRLAGFMRYSLYQDEKLHTIGNEMELLKDYIALEKIRHNQTMINFNYEIDEAGLHFPPLLFMPIVENAFKFCIENKGEDSWILIQLNLKKGFVFFKVVNTFKETASRQTGGIGLRNVQKRLHHYYGDNYSFEAREQQQIFTVTIQAYLKKHD